jgi:hypothetical protein
MDRLVNWFLAPRKAAMQVEFDLLVAGSNFHERVVRAKFIRELAPVVGLDLSRLTKPLESYHIRTLNILVTEIIKRVEDAKDSE